jgi:hypothetical protein
MTSAAFEMCYMTWNAQQQQQQQQQEEAVSVSSKAAQAATQAAEQHLLQCCAEAPIKHFACSKPRWWAHSTMWFICG